MREILFRAKRKDNSEWVEGYLFDDGFPNPKHYFVVGIIVKPYIGDADDKWNIVGIDFCEIDPETLCQYTGKTDETGKKIYEKDIVGFIDVTSTESGYSEHNCVGEVLWDEEECCFHVTDRLSAESWEILNECRILGNTFDNKEILEEF